jgi:hypothetical protein
VKAEKRYIQPFSADPAFNVSGTKLVYVHKKTLIHPDRIVMIKAADQQLHFFTDFGGGYTVDSSLHSISGMLAAFPGNWTRTSRDFAVRTTSITHMVGGWVYLVTGDRAPASRRQRLQLIEAAYLGRLPARERAAARQAMRDEL